MQKTLMAITVRPERAEDESFLRRLYASTREEELDAWGWTAEMRESFLDMQFKASRALHVHYPNAEFLIVLADGFEVGRMIIHRTPDVLHLADIALLTRYRRGGLGTALMQRLFGEAIGTRKPVRIQVLKASPAVRFYERLGFLPVGEDELRLEMEWRAPALESRAKTVPDSIKLPLCFEPARLRRDLSGILSSEFIPHFNKAYYQGDWSAVPLRSVGGQVDQIYPDPTAKDAYANTPLLERCPYFQEVLASLRCPQQAARLLRLKAGSAIKEHRDYELGFEDGEVRLHIPVITNSEVDFVLNRERVIMNEGECWYLNVNQPHRVSNRGANDRIHLVVDCVLNDWLRSLLLNAASASEQRSAAQANPVA